MARASLAIVLAFSLLSASPARPQPPRAFDVGADRPVRALAVLGDVEPGRAAELPADLTASPMLLRLAGGLAELKGPAAGKLEALVAPGADVPDPSGAVRVATLLLFGSGAERATLTLRRTPGGEFFVASPTALAPLKRSDAAGVISGWAAYRGGFDRAQDERGALFEVPRPYAPGLWGLDRATIKDRLNGGQTWLSEGATRDLERERLVARLPRAYTPREPAGLVVWTSPTDRGAIPAVFHGVLDELNLIAVGFERAGNERALVDRVQLALDAVRTAQERWHVDPKRVYAAGFSGGGRVSTILAGCFPEVFSGGVALGALACYQPVPDGVGSYWRQSFAPPPESRMSLWRAHRLASVVGSEDPNQREAEHASAILQRDGIPARLWSPSGLAHALPDAQTLGEAVRWVDEPRSRVREAERKAAEDLVARARKRGRLDEGARRLLIRATVEGPWTEAGWSAARVLRGEEALGRP